MRDVAGNELSVGDNVVTTIDGYSYLSIVSVVGFTPKKIRVLPYEGARVITKFQDQVCLVPKQRS